jgi:hypothetical protein
LATILHGYPLLIGGWMIRAKLKRTIEYRHRVTAAAMCAIADKWRMIATST